MEDKTIIRTYEEKKTQAAEFNLTSDLFAGKVFENKKACQELCRILMQNDTICIKDVRTQYAIRNLENHSVSLDILAEDTIGSLIGIEIQMYQEASPFRRTRYYSSSLDMSILEKGKDYEALPTTTLITITKKDFIGGKRGYYEVCRNIKGKGKTKNPDNGLREKYFNLKYPTNDKAINELLNYFKNSDPFYKTRNFPNIVKRVNYFKIHKKGVTIMCEIADRIRKEGELKGEIKGKAESILELLEEFGIVPQQVFQRIIQETNLNVLSRWLKSAAKAASIEEFTSSMHL